MERDISLELFLVLSRASRSVMAHAEQDIRKHGLNPTQFGVLELLYHKGPHPLQQIGGKILLTSGSMTYVIDTLEQKGLVKRKLCAEDRRIIYAEITEKGHELMSRIFPLHEETIKQAVGSLSDEEKLQAIQLLKKLGLEAQKKLDEAP